MQENLENGIFRFILSNRKSCASERKKNGIFRFIVIENNRKSCASESPIKVDLNSKKTSHVFQGYFIRKVGTISKNVYFSLSA